MKTRLCTLLLLSSISLVGVTFEENLALAKSGKPSAQVIVADNYLENNNTQKAYDWYVQAARANNLYAQNKIAFMYDKGIWVTTDKEHAFKWYIRSARAGFKASMITVADMYKEGIGTAKNDNKSDYWYSKFLNNSNHNIIQKHKLKLKAKQLVKKETNPIATVKKIKKYKPIVIDNNTNSSAEYYYIFALNNNAQINEASYSVDVTSSNIDKVDSKNGINITWDIAAARNKDKSKNSLDDRAYSQFNYNILANKSLYNIENDLELEKANINYKKEKLLYQKILQEFSIQFLKKYFEIFKSKQYLKFTMENQLFAINHLEKIEKLYKIKYINKIDFLKAKTNLLEANEFVKIGALKLYNAKKSFETFITKKITTPLFMENSFDTLSLNNIDLVNYINNVDLQLAKYDVLLIKKDLATINKSYYPTLNLSVGYSKSDYANYSHDNLAQSSAKLLLKGNLYNGGYTASARQESKTKLLMKNSNLMKIQNELEGQINQLVVDFTTTTSDVNILKSKIIESKVSLETLLRKSEFGIIEFSEVLETQKNILNYETEKLNNIIASIEVYIQIKLLLSYNPKEIVEELVQ